MGIKIKAGMRDQHIPPGEYRARVSEIREASFIAKRKTFEFIFEIADGEHRGTSLRGFVNAEYESYSQHTKMYRWIMVNNKGDFGPGDVLDLDIFKGKILRVQVEDKISRKTKIVFSNVTDILGVYLDDGI